MVDIKFRAWNNRERKMYYEVETTYDFMEGKPEVICEDSFGDVLKNDEWNVMQYTGTKDRFGKEIYEGDIIKSKIRGCNILGNFFYLKGEVVFWKSCFCLSVKDIAHMYTLFEILEIEVIGNIYENPELLEGD